MGRGATGVNVVVGAGVVTGKLDEVPVLVPVVPPVVVEVPPVVVPVLPPVVPVF
jgi:hypothetical protein